MLLTSIIIATLNSFKFVIEIFLLDKIQEVKSRNNINGQKHVIK